MSTKKRRINQIETELTPKQVILLWLQEVQEFDNAFDYVRQLQT